jgi:putative membrane protein
MIKALLHPQPVNFANNKLLQLYCGGFLAIWVLTFAGTIDRINFFIENILVVAGVIVLTATYRRFKFSNLSYTCIFLFLLLHLYGAQYAYTANPLGAWLQQHLHFNRNPYDRIVHTAFGVLLAFPIRDLLKNKFGFGNRAAWILPAEMILSLAALFELVEWAVADIIFPAHGASYVATQGDVWDVQKDIFVAFAGAVAVLVTGWGITVRRREPKQLCQ